MKIIKKTALLLLEFIVLSINSYVILRYDYPLFILMMLAETLDIIIVAIKLTE